MSAIMSRTFLYSAKGHQQLQLILVRQLDLKEKKIASQNKYILLEKNLPFIEDRE